MIFNNFPENPEMFAEDMQPLITGIIALHGRQEWKAGVLTNELHGHLGIYTVVGVKMGIKALEYLRTEAGSVRIDSFAGTVPPVSCMNDGLQVSTGATFGHGLISSHSTDNPLPEAIFSVDGKSIRINLKASSATMIKEEIVWAVEKYGYSTGYWEYIRQLAISYWHELDRNRIFEIRTL